VLGQGGGKEVGGGEEEKGGGERVEINVPWLGGEGKG